MSKEPTDVDDVVLAIDMLIDTRIRRFHAGQYIWQEDVIVEADLCCNSALKRLKDVLQRWKR